MLSITLRGLLASTLLWMLFCGPVGPPIAYGQSTSPTPEAFLEYRIHRGETLENTARLFAIPIEELARLNHISDPTRLQIDQLVKIPNVFARQVAQLQEERTRLLQDKEQLEQQARQQQSLFAAKEAEFHKIEGENVTLADELAAVGHWKRGAQILAGLLLGVFIWGLRSRKEQARHGHTLAVLFQENAALTAAKEKYRQAAAHLELRYQKLFSARSQVPEKFISEGVALITRSFAEGSAQLEHLLAKIQTERSIEEQTASREQTVIDSLLQPLRGFWHRFKYHGA